MSTKGKASKKAKDVVIQAVDNVKNIVSGLTDNVNQEFVKLMDENGNGKVDLEDVIVKALRVPGVKVDRAAYLRKALAKYCDEDTIEKAIESRPAKAGIRVETVEKAARESIALQKSLATTTSVGLGYVPGGAAVDIATTVADIGQFYAHELIIIQKLMYLYGYPEINLTLGKDGIDDGIMNMIVICLGVMHGIKVASKYLLKMSNMLANGVAKTLLKQALTKKTAYKVCKKVLSYFGVNLTKSLAVKGIANGIKFLGGVLVGGITLFTFGEACTNLNKTLRESQLADPNYVFEGGVVDAEYTSIDDVECEFENEFSENELKDETEETAN